MADPTAATLSFLSWVRQGLAARRDAGLAVKDGHLSLPVRLRLNNADLADVPVELYGPGDIVGIDAREIVRVEPQHLMADFEPNYLPFVEFDHPDFPWMFTPAAADAAGRLPPWLCLVAVRKSGAQLTADTSRPLPVLECPVQELPDLAESWAWAHAQVTRSAAAPNVSDALAQRERTVSRLLCPRRLEPATAYYACLVPAYAVGRMAGLGESFTIEDERALRPAWTATAPGGGAQATLRLPVYYHWEFSTGTAGDFEALARRLEPRPLPAEVGVKEMDVSRPGWGVGPFPAKAAGAVVKLEGALRNPNVPTTPWPADVRTPFQKKLRQILDTSARPASSASAPAVGPPLYGQWYPKLETLPAAGAPPHWLSEVNLDPRYRVAAGLGALVVRYRQEELMAEAWDQLAAQQADNEQRKRAQLAEEVRQTLAAKHLAPLSPQGLTQMTAPLRAAAAPPAAATTAAAFRRMARARGPIARRLAAEGRAVSAGAAGLLKSAASTARAVAQPSEAPAAERTDLVRFAPTFTGPMYEPLRDYFADMLLPGLEHVPANSVSLLVTNPKFVEAYMLGLNHEMSRELLWRDYPADLRATYFRQFWDVSGHTPQERSRLADITPVADWRDNSHLGEHSGGGAPAAQIVLVIRGDLINRYPRALIYALEARWSGSAARVPGTSELYPLFRVTRAPDITMLGFALTKQQARGADASTGGAGWFFVLQEQPTEPRFRLDAATPQTFGARPAKWSDLSWGHLAANADSLRQIVYVPLNGTPKSPPPALKNPPAGSATWGKNSAHMASILRQNPFRLVIHARTWLAA